ncbi:uncharacterized protein DS421_6g185460 [Arachis hypogaea]|nr:uncharacterized protein DS421_6g185460 [Arachis hypogaea]
MASFLNQKAQIQTALATSQSKGSFNRSFTCFKKMKNPHLMKKVMKKLKTVKLRKTVSKFV